jgi:DNA-binding response OmpR family regulator
MPRLRILHVDDDGHVRHAVARTLSSAGMIVTSASTIDQAELALQRALRFDLAIVDRRIDDEDGLELVRVLRAEYPRMMVLLLSRSLPDEEVERAYDLGVSGCIEKPHDPGLLIEQVRFFARGSGTMPAIRVDAASGSGTDG